MGDQWNWGSWGQQQPKQPRSPFFDTIQNTATQHGLDPSLLHAFVKIESGGNPYNRTGSYKGLLQLSDSEFNKYGGKGDIFDPQANLTAGALKLKSESAQFAQKFGRQPTAAELYMMHQQGWGGAQNHWQNPTAPAWQNMLNTAEGQQKGPAWARAAIWGNVPDDLKKQFGSVDNITSADFTKLWGDKVARLSGQQPQQPQPQAQDPMNLFDPELLRKALEMQNAPPQQMPDASQTQPHIMTSALAMPQPQDQPTSVPAQPVMPPMQMQQPEQKPMGFLDRLSAALNQPLTQQGLGLFLAASQGADLNKGMNAGMDRASAALKNQELQRQAQLRDMREAVIAGWQKQPPPWMANLPAGLQQIIPLLGADKASEVFGNYFLNKDKNDLDREVQRTNLEIMRKKIENDQYEGVKDNEVGTRNKITGEIQWLPNATGLHREFDKENAKKLADTFNSYVEEGQSKVQLGQDLARMRELSSIIGDQTKTGEFVGKYGSWLRTLGYDASNVNQLQEFQRMITRMAPQLRPKGSGTMTDIEQAKYEQSLPDIALTQEGRENILKSFEAQVRYATERARIAQMARARKISPTEAEEKIQALAEDYGKAVRNVTSGFKTNANAPQQQTQLPMSPDQQMAANIAGNNQFPDHAKALAAIKTAQPGVTKQVVMNGQVVTLRKRQEGGWEVIPANQAQPQQSDEWTMNMSPQQVWQKMGIPR